MFEKPQYRTPKGFKRTLKNPSMKKGSKSVLPIKANLPSKVKLFNREGRGISKEAAKLIAQALKGMLKQ